MKSDFDMIVWDFPQGDGITIIPISDVHFGSAECMEKEFRQFIKDLEYMDNTYIVIAGDMLNNSTRSSVANPFDEVYRPSEQKILMAEILKPVSKRILAGCCGNHESRSIRESDSDPLLDVFSKCNIESRYRSNMAFLQIRFGAENHNLRGDSRPSYTIGVTHGSGGGSLTGSAVNKNERFAYAIDGLDCLITGHTHKPVYSTPQKLKIDPRNKQVKFVPFKCLTATAWLNYGGYALNKQLLPASHSLQRVYLNGSKKEMTVTF